MQKRRLMISTFAGMAVVLLCLSPMSALGSDRPSSTDKTATPPAETAAKTTTDTNDQVTLLKQQMAIQQQQIEQLQKALEAQKRLLEQLTQITEKAAQPAAPKAGQVAATTSAAQPAAQPQTPNLGQVASTTPMIPKDQSKVENTALPAAGTPTAALGSPPKSETEPTSPLQIHIGDAAITPVGFMDFTAVGRSKTNGSGIGTNFGNIPYGTTGYQQNLSEFRFNMQNSRIGFRVDADVLGAHVIGYMEADFLGNNPANVAVTSNSNTLRSRVYWVDWRRGGWEILGGQTWSLITPGRNGISPIPADIFYSQDMDVNYQAGLFWGRIPELRFVYHLPEDKAAFAFALESPEQYMGGSGGGGLSSLPTALAALAGTQLNNATNTLGVPNLAPDLIAKLMIQPNKHFHFEVGGVERDFKLYNTVTNVNNSAEGGGGFVNLNFDLFKGFKILTNNFYGDGVGRYIFGLAPDLAVHTDGTPSLLHSGSTVSGFEYTNKNTLFYAYYGGVYIGRDTIKDTNGKIIGYGCQGATCAFNNSSSATSQNRAIQEATFGVVQTFWKNPKYGALSLITQYSYLVRDPWYIAPATPANPRNANLNMVFGDLRYTLPGSAPTIGH